MADQVSDEQVCGEARPAQVGEQEMHCTLPVGHNLHRKGGTAWEEFRVACSCDGDPVECSHEAARGQAEAERNTARAELTGAYRGAEELRGMYRDLKDRATEIERQRDQLTTEQATVFAALAEALGYRPATLGQAVAHVITALADARAACTTAEGQRDDYRAAHKTAVDQVTRLKERVAELSELEAGIKHLTAADGSIDMDLSVAHDLMRIYVASFVEILDAAGAPNFVELMFKLAGSTDRYTVTIRRPGGETPGEVLGRVRAEGDRLRAMLREFVQDSPCDPHPGNGFCQSHGEKAPCPHAEAKELLARAGAEAGR